MSLPHDLIPLPTQPWPSRPVELPLDLEECRTALWRCRGNVTEAAKLLKVTSARLRKFVDSSPYLSAEMRESREQMLDLAEANLVEALEDPEDTARRDIATKFVLKELGGFRGYGQSGKGITIKTGTATGRMTIAWGDEDDNPMPDYGRTIDGEVNDE